MELLDLPVELVIEEESVNLNVQEENIDSSFDDVELELFGMEDTTIDLMDLDCELNVDFGIISERILDGEADIYDGEYHVIPKVSEQTLQTTRKFMTKDVTIEKIPLYEVDNKKGTTIIIGDK